MNQERQMRRTLDGKLQYRIRVSQRYHRIPVRERKHISKQELADAEIVRRVRWSRWYPMEG